MGLYNKVAKEIAVPQREGMGGNASYGMGAQTPARSGAPAGF
ncbi:MAG: hypothetical protein QM704_26020 [Anaeromyxobacteraceae bacterium]